MQTWPGLIGKEAVLGWLGWEQVLEGLGCGGVGPLRAGSCSLVSWFHLSLFLQSAEESGKSCLALAVLGKYVAEFEVKNGRE